MTLSTRRRFLEISAGLAGRVAASGAVSLPVLVSMSKKAKARNEHGKDKDDQSCFLRGTRILTPQGELAVEDLTIGTEVETLNGPMPIKWIGRQRFQKTSPSWHWSVAPIRITRFALSDQYPHRDLYLSGRHCIFTDGVLIPVGLLVNGRSILLAANEFDVIEYFHIELETHQVIYAEGAPAETFLLTNDRERFSNFVEYERLYGAEEPRAVEQVAPILRYDGVRDEPARLLRAAVSKVVDVRDPIQKIRARFTARAQLVGL